MQASRENTSGPMEKLSNLYSKVTAKVNNFIHPPTSAMRNERNSTIQNFALFTVSTVALMALQRKISKALTI